MNSKIKKEKKYIGKLIGRRVQVDFDMNTPGENLSRHGEVGEIVAVREDGTIKLLFEDGETCTHEAAYLAMFSNKWEVLQFLMQEIDGMSRSEITIIQRILQLRKENKEGEALQLAMEQEETREIFITYCDHWIQQRKDWKKLPSIIESYLSDPMLS